MDLSYDCGRHNNHFLEANWKRAIYALSQIETIQMKPYIFCDTIMDNIMVHYRNSKSNNKNTNPDLIYFTYIKNSKI